MNRPQSTEHAVLVIDPDPEVHEALRARLDSSSFQLRFATTIREAQALLDLGRVDLVLVAVDLPDGSGMELTRAILQSGRDCSVLVLAASASVEAAVAALRLGAADFLPTPLAALAVVAERVEAAASALDRTRQQQQQVRDLESLVTRDPLTGLFNHAHFQERLSHELSRAERYHHPLCLVFVDVDKFKDVNDTLGHQVGDMVLTTISEVMRGRSRSADVHFRLREHDIAARYGGDEFVLLLPETAKTGGAITAERLRNSVETQPFDLAIPPVTLSIGIAGFPEDGGDRDALIRAADTALYVAKGNGRNQVVSYTPGMAGATGRRIAEQIIDVQRLAALQKTITEGALRFAYQPIVEAERRQLMGYEAFCRPEQAAFDGPVDLIVTAEQTGRIGDLGRVMREKAVAPAAQLPDGCLLFVNLHPQELNDPSLLEPSARVRQFANRIVLEITRTREIGDQRRLLDSLVKLRSFGFRIALDDLREGYLGLNAVTRLEPDFLRLPMGMLRDVHTDPRGSRLIRHYVELAREEQIMVIVGRVETEQDCRIAGDLGCDWLQGYHIGAPEPPFSQVASPQSR